MCARYSADTTASAGPVRRSRSATDAMPTCRTRTTTIVTPPATSATRTARVIGRARAAAPAAARALRALRIGHRDVFRLAEDLGHPVRFRVRRRAQTRDLLLDVV